MDSKYRVWKFTKYQQKQKEIMRICKLLSRKKHPRCPDTTLVGFGDWSAKSSILKGNRRGPVTQIKRELSRWTKVVDVPPR